MTTSFRVDTDRVPVGSISIARFSALGLALPTIASLDLSLRGKNKVEKYHDHSDRWFVVSGNWGCCTWLHLTLVMSFQKHTF